MTHELSGHRLDEAIPSNFGDLLHEVEVSQDFDRLLALKLALSDLRARCFELLGEPLITTQQRRRVEARNVLLTCGVQVCDAKLYLIRHKDSYERYRVQKTLDKLLTAKEVAALRWLTFLDFDEQRATLTRALHPPEPFCDHPLDALVDLFTAAQAANQPTL